MIEKQKEINELLEELGRWARAIVKQVGRAFALHMAYEGLIPGLSYGPRNCKSNF